METKARYILVGAFPLGAMAALLGFLLWLGHGDRGGGRPFLPARPHMDFGSGCREGMAGYTSSRVLFTQFALAPQVNLPAELHCCAAAGAAGPSVARKVPFPA